MQFSIYNHKLITSNKLNTPFRKIQKRDVIDVSVEWAPTCTLFNANVVYFLSTLNNLRTTSICVFTVLFKSSQVKRFYFMFCTSTARKYSIIYIYIYIYIYILQIQQNTKRRPQKLKTYKYGPPFVYFMEIHA